MSFWMGGRIEVRGGRWLTVVCVREPNLPPSAVRVGDVRATGAPGPPSSSLCLSLPLFTGNVMLSAHICLSAVEGGWGQGSVRGGRGGGGDIGTWAASVFFLSLSTLVFLPVRR